MSLAIKYNNEFLDLAPNQSIELERLNPLFNTESIIAEYSTPITIVASEKNIRLLGPEVFLDLNYKSKKKFDVGFYDNNTFTYNSLLVLDKSISNRLVPGKGTATGFLLIGTSKFYNNLKDRKACDLDYDSSNRIFDFTTWNGTDTSGGYWQIFHSSWANTMDFVVAPFYNEWSNLEVINKLNTTQLYQFGYIAIQPRVKYVMQKLVEENGWSFDSSEMNGTDWERLFLFNPKTIEYFDITTDPFNPSSITLTEKSRIQIFLGRCISPELTCADLFFELCKHYGWAALIDHHNQHVKLLPLKKHNNNSIQKDFTQYASQSVSNEFTDSKKIFAFKNAFPSNENLSSFNKDDYQIAPPVLTYTALPTAAAPYDNHIVFVYAENKYYTIDLDGNNNRIWVPIGDNIYDAETPDNTETVESKVTTLAMYRKVNRSIVDGTNITDYYQFLPTCEVNPTKDWGIRTLLYLGMAYEEEADGTPTSNQYPQLSSIRCLHDGTDVAMFSNVFNHVNPNTNIDLGIIPYWFKKWTDVAAVSEVNEQKIYLPLHLLREILWNDLVCLFNIPYFIRSYIEPRPYLGYIQAKLQRAVNVAATYTPTKKGVYLSLVNEDIRVGNNEYLFGQLMSDDITEMKPVVYAFSDSNGTIPISVNSLVVKLIWKVGTEVAGVTTWSNYADLHFKLNGNKQILTNVILNSDTTGITDLDFTKSARNPYFIYKQHSIGTPSNEYLLNKFELNTSSDYDIIP